MSGKDLLSRLTEDTGSPEKAAELLPVIHKLQQWETPVPVTGETAHLSKTLQRFIKTRHVPSVSYRLRLGWLLLYSQLRVVQREIWAASALVMGLGILIALGYGVAGSANLSLPFMLLAPVAAAVGVAFLYGPAMDPALEIELTTPVSPRQMLVARLVLVFSFDLLLGLTGSAILSCLRTDVYFWPLVSTWLAPMTFLTSLAFLLTILTMNSGISLLVCLMLWVIQNIRYVIDVSRLPFTLPDLTTANVRPWLWLLTIVLGSVAFWLGGSEERWLRKQA